MPVLPGYTLDKLIYQGNFSLVYRATQLATNRAVILKMLRFPSPEEENRFRREFRMARQLSGHGGPAVYGMERMEASWMMVLEDFGGISLDRLVSEGKPLALETFLELAVRMADLLDRVHQRRIMHKDIQPGNFIWNPETGRLAIIDFGISTALPVERRAAVAPERLEGTPAFMSPEQTGRMNRVMDYRTDLYSLGASFYYLLTTRPPFLESDAMRLVYSHLARLPEPPHSVDSRIPQAVSHIVMKLMEKNAENRYQTAHGVRADLQRCLDHLRKEGHIPAFGLATEDTSDRFSIPEKLYARQVERDTLLTTFERAGNGLKSLLLVAGYPGIGKSALIHEVHKPIAERNGLFISGKFDQYKRNIPYSSFIQAFRELLNQQLTESPENLAARREDLLKVLEGNGAVLIEVFPELELIIGPQPPVPELPPMEAMNRFNLVFLRFLGVFAREEHPLVIFLDDLQWADEPSLKLIEYCMTDQGPAHLLIIGAYRDNEVDGHHPLMTLIANLDQAHIRIKTLVPAALGLEDITRMTADTLHRKPAEVAPLAELLLAKTGGNPFFLVQFLESLYRSQLIVFNNSTRRWDWFPEKIAEAGYTGNVIDLMVRKIKRLDPQTVEVLKPAACIGNRFDLKLVAIVCQKSPADTAASLWPALREGVVQPVGDAWQYEQTGEDAGNMSYRFLHDRVQQAAYALITPEREAETRLQIGRLLLAQLDESEIEEKLFDIVSHLNQGVACIDDPAERRKLALMNLAAGRKARHATAYMPSLEYLNKGRALLPEDCWTVCFDLAFELTLLAAECSFLTRQWDQAEELFRLLFARELNRENMVQLYLHYFAYFDHRRDLQQALDVGTEALAKLGFKLVRTPEEIARETELEMSEVLKWLANHSMSEVPGAPDCQDADLLTISNLLATITAAAYNREPPLFDLIVLKQANLALKHGNTPTASFAYATLGILLSSRGRHETGYKLGLLGLEVDKRYDNPLIANKVFFVNGCFLLHWVHHVRDSVPYLKRAYQGSLAVGDFVYAYYALWVTAITRYAEEAPLPVQSRECRHSISLIDKSGGMGLYVAIQGILGTTLALQGLSPDRDEPAAHTLEEILYLLDRHSFAPGAHAFLVFQMQTLYLQENYREALRVVDEADRLYDHVSGIITQSLHTLYKGLTAAALLPEAPHEERISLAKILETCTTRMEDWAQSCPENFGHKWTLLLAESARVENNPLSAMKYYEQAAAEANAAAFPGSAGLANELAARHCLANGLQQAAGAYLRAAAACYLNWGATGRVSELKRRHPDVIVSEQKRGVDIREDTVTISADRTDMAQILRAATVFFRQPGVDRLAAVLLRTAMEHGGAERGFVLISQDGTWVIKAEGNAHAREPVTMTRRAASDELLPMAVIQFVEKTGKTLVLEDAARDRGFGKAGYIARHKPRSVLCLPLPGRRTMIYLENNHNPGAFSADRVEVLRQLANQASIALDQTTRYEEQARLSEDRARRLVEQEKDVCLGRVGRGIAGESEKAASAASETVRSMRRRLDRLEEDLKQIEDKQERARYLDKTLDELDHGLETIRRNSRRIRGTAEVFGRLTGDDRKQGRIDLSETVHETVDLVTSAFPAVTVVEHLTENIPLACRPSALSRVFIHLAFNACHALMERRQEEGGEAPAKLTVITRYDDKEAVVIFADTGTGMSADQLEKVFQPFFSTGRGIGLGLVTARRIIGEHGGTVKLRSKQGVGTDITIRLPLTRN
ncbi:MAG: AAA family ATPase [Acidobacteriota bacterium]|nr:AAA family ATPase [Acidobacteriota bacterium]